MVSETSDFVMSSPLAAKQTAKERGTPVLQTLALDPGTESIGLRGSREFNNTINTQIKKQLRVHKNG